MPAKGKNEWPRTVSFGAGRVRVAKRSNGFFALTWREMGETRRTTKTTEKAALDWARDKAQDLDGGSGRRWVSPAEAEMVGALRSIAGSGEGAVRKLVDQVRGAVAALEGSGTDIETAAEWYAKHGPVTVSTVTVGAAVARFLAEYDGGSKETRRSFGQELEALLRTREDSALLDLSTEELERWVHRKVGGGGAPAPRTLRNRITTWVTFLNRCRDWRLIPEGKHVADVLRKPVIPDAGKEIFTVDQGRRLIEAVREKDRRLEAYLLIGGWLGLRPSEIQRLTWESMEWDRGYCHVTHLVARKVTSERFVPVDPRVMRRLREIRTERKAAASAKVAPFRAREFLSLLARAEGIVERWPEDVLRHSYCSYRLAVVKSLDQVADEAGNSPAILKSNYRRPLRHEDGLAWWSILGEPLPDNQP